MFLVGSPSRLHLLCRTLSSHTHTRTLWRWKKKWDEEKQRKTRSVAAWSVSCSCSFLYRQSVKVRIYKVWLPQCSAASTTTTSTATLLQLAATTILNSLCRPRLNGRLDWVHASATTTRHEKRQAWAWVIIYHFYVCSTSEFPVNLMYKIF